MRGIRLEGFGSIFALILQRLKNIPDRLQNDGAAVVDILRQISCWASFHGNAKVVDMPGTRDFLDVDNEGSPAFPYLRLEIVEDLVLAWLVPLDVFSSTVRIPRGERNGMAAFLVAQLLVQCLSAHGLARGLLESFSPFHLVGVAFSVVVHCEEVCCFCGGGTVVSCDWSVTSSGHLIPSRL